MVGTGDAAAPGDEASTDAAAPTDATGSMIDVVTGTLVARVDELLGSGVDPVVVGIDGRSGSGKSTLTTAFADALARRDLHPAVATVIEGDDFYTGGSPATWDGRTAAENAERVIDWRRQRDVLERLRAGGVARWHPFDWDADTWDDDVVPYLAEPVVARPAPVVVLEGAYSCRPQVADLLDVRVLVAIPEHVRRRRLVEREGDDFVSEWDTRWAAAEEHYFGHVVPAGRFDLVLAPSDNAR